MIATTMTFDASDLSTLRDALWEAVAQIDYRLDTDWDDYDEDDRAQMQADMDYYGRLARRIQATLVGDPANPTREVIS